MYRAYHAIRGLTAPDGRSTNAIYGFVTMLRKLINDHKPQCIAAPFDLRGPTFRSEMRDDYKANRAPMPSDLGRADRVRSPGMRSARRSGPDLRGLRSRRRDWHAGDARCGGRPSRRNRDRRQGFLSARQTTRTAFACSTRRTKARGTTRPRVKEKLGVTPEQAIDVLALMGDTIDNIKGVPGIGEKGARDLIATHGSLDTLLENAGSLTQKKYREALARATQTPHAKAGCSSDPHRCAAARCRHVVLRLSGAESPEMLRAVSRCSDSGRS